MDETLAQMETLRAKMDTLIVPMETLIVLLYAPKHKAHWVPALDASTDSTGLELPGVHAYILGWYLH